MAKPVAGVEIGLVDGVLTVNPTKAEMALSTLQLTVAGTKDGILMIEGAANFLPEEIMVDALKIGKQRRGRRSGKVRNRRGWRREVVVEEGREEEEEGKEEEEYGMAV